MASFGIKIEESKELLEYILETKERLKQGNLLTNPFNAELLNLGDCLAISIEPVYPNFPAYTSFFFMVSGVFFIRHILWPIGLVFALLTMFWSKYFYYIMFRLGSKKAGYNGVFKLMNQKEIIMRLIQYGTERSAKVS